MKATELFRQYPLLPNTWDEMYDEDQVRRHYQNVFESLSSIPADELSKKEELAKSLFMSQGITFTVYSSGEGIERYFLLILSPGSLLLQSGISLSVVSNSAFARSTCS